ncbi:MAG TPA: co-chaperone GroES family protein [Nannocystaceae bacterium]|nr:co-chaperone GroES family protein [Nannocystaceae bacterium]
MSRPPRSKPKDDAPAPVAAIETPIVAPAAVARHIQPLGPRVLVRIVKSPDRSEAGLFLPQGVKDTHSAALLGEVVEVARTMPKSPTVGDDDDDDDDDGDDDDDASADLGENVSGIPLGANVLFEKERGVAVPWDESLRILEVRWVLAIVDIIAQEDIQ